MSHCWETLGTYCHSEGGQSPTEESLKESLVAKRDSSVVSLPQNDKLSYPQGKLFCHSKHCEESLLSTKDSLNESLVVKSNSSAFAK
ncbi:hypothetical protein [Helicobacter marmotae]|uniref:hypothetical protein n=1 Tax=Helicobacter marmotae TaxID=152490 RepID=UPI00131560FE|nr:hypothetical protein [Helicobacter marmotae]